MSSNENIFVGLDIGTTKICTIIGENVGGDVEIIGIGSAPSKGLRKGVVVNIESTVNSIRKAVEEAELMAGVELKTVYAGIAGGHIKGFNSHGIIAVKNREVSEGDIKRVIDAARAIAIPVDREVIHILPQEYIVDDQDGIQQPLGMNGVRLEAKVHIVTGAVTSAQNIIRCVNRTGMDVSTIVLEQLASAKAVLSEDEKELGVVIVDIGGGTTDVAVFSEGSIKHTMVITLGGNHLTNDIAVGLRTPMIEAERIKKKSGCAMASLVDKDETIEVPSVGGRKPRIISRQILAEIIEPRVEEILSLVQREVARSGYGDLLASGVVLTGGSSLLTGIADMGEHIFNMPVRVGYPRGISGLVDLVNSPMYATGVGLVLYGSANGGSARFKVGDGNIFGKVTERFKEIIRDYF
ncbi:MAG: cell division protein FtsA [Deltaproteobacteria bacterium]|uniref:Cell division protein FtsA n=1 Tax=Candidatus Zymogenus saltonus TaxID=2844893 RepID=A0A9D8KF73_9DELT|nr:cell division protein FtsA [Candidatus Zymogenus saltonus]